LSTNKQEKKYLKMVRGAHPAWLQKINYYK